MPDSPSPWKYKGEHVCMWKDCTKSTDRYHDATYGPLFDPRYHCEEHEQDVLDQIAKEDQQREKDYQEHKEWMENYRGIPTEEM